MDAGDSKAWSAMVAAAREKWSRAEPVRESAGRPPKRSKCSRWRSQQQRAFAAGLLHSVRIYEGLQQHEKEIRAMLYVRGMIDEAEARRCVGAASGVRPSNDDGANALAAHAWLDANCFVSACDDDSRAMTPTGLRVRLVNDSVLARRDSTSGLRTFCALEQLCAWVYLWADRGFELKWLGMGEGFGVFTTGATEHVCPSTLQAVADYELRDPHALIQVRATLSDRKRGDSTPDYVSAYGPSALLNAACKKHSSVAFTDADIGQAGKLVSLKWKPSARSQHRQSDMKRQLFAAYDAPEAQAWFCEALSPQRRCHQRVGS